MSAIHTEIINYIIAKKGFTSYLEIGIRRVEQNFQHIRCKFKIGVDPDPNAHASFMGTSDEWFEYNYRLNGGPIVRNPFDIIFIDGLHEHEQVRRDFYNSLACLSPSGIILIHDTNPEKEDFARFPRDKIKRWNGTVWKFLFDLNEIETLDYRTIDSDPNGLTIVKEQNTGSHQWFDPDAGFDYFDKNRAGITRLSTRQQFEEWI